MDAGLLLLRVVVGLALAAHGAQKLFGWFGGYGIAGTGGYLEQLGFVPGRRAAVMAGLSEFGGGLLLALGAVTPLAATLIVGVMFTAIMSVHIRKGFFNHVGGYEYPLVLAVSALSIVLAGPGRYSVDAALGAHLHGPAWAVGTLIAGVAGGGFQLLTRRQQPAAAQPQSA
jgi:putative oxidoreductase